MKESELYNAALGLGVANNKQFATLKKDKKVAQGRMDKLNDILMRELEVLTSETDKDNLKLEIEKARSVSSLAKNLAYNAKLEIEARKLAYEADTDFILLGENSED